MSEYSPNKYAQAATLNKGASKYTQNASNGPDSMAKPKYEEALNKKGTGVYNVDKQGGCYQGRGVSDKPGDMKPNKDPRD